jgi:ABC-type multidrug transport system fused ATPase/permease subunit
MALFIKKKLQPLVSFVGLYISILREGGLKYWKRVIVIGIFDFLAVFSAASTMIVIAVIVSGAGREDLLGLVNKILQYMTFEITNEKFAQLGVLIIGGILSSGLILFAAISRFLAAFNGRKIARIYHDLFGLFDGLKKMPDLPGIKVGGDLNVALIQDTIHASKALETLLRLPQVILFSTFLFIGAVKLQPYAMLALGIACIIGVPVIALTSRRIQSASSSFFENSSRKYGGEIASIMNGFETCATAYPPAKVKLKDEYYKAEEFYFDTFDEVQLSADRMNLASSVVRALGFGTAFVFVASLAVIQEADITTVIAFATIVYLFVSQLQNLFGSLSTLVVFYPQARRLFVVREQLIGIQKQNINVSAQNFGETDRVIQKNISDFTPPIIDGAELRESIASSTISKGGLYHVIVSVMPGRFNFAEVLEKINETLSQPIESEDAVYFKSAGHDFSEITLSDIDAKLNKVRGLSLNELAEGMNFSDALKELEDTLNSEDQEKPLSTKVITSLSGPEQGFVALAVALCNDVGHLFIEHSYVARFHGEARKYVISTLQDFVIWPMSATDVVTPLQEETLKINVREETAQWTYVEDVLGAVSASSEDVSDSSMTVII